MDCELKQIIKDYIDEFNQANENPILKNYVVPSSIPIIWFGNIEKYRSSSLKIVTVGLNPSCSEFLNDQKQLLPFQSRRFERIDLSHYDDIRINALYNTLNKYFDVNPYRHYFDQYNELLKGINASYFRNKAINTAIHIDVYSAIATDPIFGKLDKKVQAALKIRGKELYKKLINYLNPDIILFSAGQDIFYDLYADWQLLEQQEFTKGVFINIYRNSSVSSTEKSCLLLHGRNFHGTPFGGTTRETAKCTIQEFVEKHTASKF